MPTIQDPTDEEIRAHLDQMSQKHMEDGSTLRDIIEWLFKHQERLPDGTTKEQAAHMTRFKQIELLERISKDHSLLGNTEVQWGEICQFVEGVDKLGYRTADDF